MWEKIIIARIIIIIILICDNKRNIIIKMWLKFEMDFVTILTKRNSTDFKLNPNIAQGK